MFKICVEQLPEAIFFSLFILFAKGLKEKRFLFVFLICIEYLLLLKWQPYGIYSRLSFFIVTYTVLKIVYKEEAKITDVFLLGIASIILIISCAIFSIFFILDIFQYEYCTVANRIFLFAFLYIFGYKLNIIQNIYMKYWNRNDKIKKKIKSLTFRNINIVFFNFMFFIINLGLTFAIYFNNK